VWSPFSKGFALKNGHHFGTPPNQYFIKNYAYLTSYARRNFASDSINGVDFRKFHDFLVQNLCQKISFSSKAMLI